MSQCIIPGCAKLAMASQHDVESRYCSAECMTERRLDKCDGQIRTLDETFTFFKIQYTEADALRWFTESTKVGGQESSNQNSIGVLGGQAVAQVACVCGRLIAPGNGFCSVECSKSRFAPLPRPTQITDSYDQANPQEGVCYCRAEIETGLSYCSLECMDAAETGLPPVLRTCGCGKHLRAGQSFCNPDCMERWGPAPSAAPGQACQDQAAALNPAGASSAVQSTSLCHCGKQTWDGKEGFCSTLCRNQWAHSGPASVPATPVPMAVAAKALCQCGKPTWDGKQGSVCSTACRDQSMGNSAVPIDAEAHAILDQAKTRRWTEVFTKLGALNFRCYVDYVPKPRRFGLIHFAAQQGNIEAIRRLIGEFQAQPLLLTMEGHAPKDIAREAGQSAAAVVCEELGGAPARVVCPCGKPTWNGKQGSFCSTACQDRAASPSPAVAPAFSDSKVSCYCGKPTWNGKPGFCGTVCRDQASSAGMAAAPNSGGLAVLGSVSLPVSAEAHAILDFAKAGLWDQVFGKLQVLPSNLYVNYFPHPRRYGLIHYAAQQGRADVLRRLVEQFHAQVNLETLDGKSPADLARQADKPEIAILCEQIG